MGLVICKILSEKHGGNLFLSNDSEMGAKVFVKLKIRNGQNDIAKCISQKFFS